MSRASRYSADFRARAVRLVAEARPDHSTEWAAMTSVAVKLGVSAETVRKWVRRAEVDAGQRRGEIGMLTPAEKETAYYRQSRPLTEVGTQ